MLETNGMKFSTVVSLAKKKKYNRDNTGGGRSSLLTTIEKEVTTFIAFVSHSARQESSCSENINTSNQ